MSSWAQRMHRRAATLGSVVTSCGHPGPGPYPHRLEKVKFGITLDEVCKNDIPGPLLVLILKLNKEAPLRKDIFRAPGHQGAMKKLIHFLQSGRLVNVDNYSVYTIASVLKKFLRKLPGGIFGRNGETELFTIINIEDEKLKQDKIHRLILSLPVYTQRLLVLLFGTFRVIASNADSAGTGMTSEALGVSVAPSFFQSCVSDGKTARMEDVDRFKVATKIMKQMIEQFAAFNLFGRENYEYYARVTGRVLRVQDEWICSFRYPPTPRVQLSLETEKTWLQCECERWGLNQDESHSTPALLTSGGQDVVNSAISLGIIPEHTLLESCTRLSVSLEGPGIFTLQKNQTSHNGTSSSKSSSTRSTNSSSYHMTMDELRAVNRYAESTKSLTYLPQVHERQTARMRTRSEWFLGARGGSLELNPDNYHHLQLHRPTSTSAVGVINGTTLQKGNNNNKNNINNISSLQSTIVGNIGLSASAESVHQQIKRPSRRGASRHLPHRSSSRRNKENGGSRQGSFRTTNNKDIRKQRAVSFEQAVAAHHHHHHHQQQHNKWCEYTINLDNNNKTSPITTSEQSLNNSHNNINIIASGGGVGISSNSNSINNIVVCNNDIHVESDDCNMMMDTDPPLPITTTTSLSAQEQQQPQPQQSQQQQQQTSIILLHHYKPPRV